MSINPGITKLLDKSTKLAFSSIDLAETKPFFTIEAKRLTTALSNNREKEYITGNDSTKLSGGIERFKHNVHGIDLTESALIAYVQKENPTYWFNKINKWINQLITKEIDSTLNWASIDLLVNTCGFKDSRLVKFVSISEKIDKTKISLNHYFVDLTL